jgi:hypothetical protein
MAPFAINTNEYNVYIREVVATTKWGLRIGEAHSDGDCKHFQVTSETKNILAERAVVEF